MFLYIDILNYSFKRAATIVNRNQGAAHFAKQQVQNLYDTDKRIKTYIDELSAEIKAYETHNLLIIDTN